MFLKVNSRLENPIDCSAIESIRNVNNFSERRHDPELTCLISEVADVCTDSQTFCSGVLEGKAQALRVYAYNAQKLKSKFTLQMQSGAHCTVLAQ